MTEAEWATLSDGEQSRLKAAAAERLRAAGADEVVDTAAELVGLLGR